MDGGGVVVAAEDAADEVGVLGRYLLAFDRVVGAFLGAADGLGDGTGGGGAAGLGGAEPLGDGALGGRRGALGGREFAGPGVEGLRRAAPFLDGALRLLEPLGEFFELGALFGRGVSKEFLGAILHAFGGLELLCGVFRAIVEFAEGFGESARSGRGLVGTGRVRARCGVWCGAGCGVGALTG